MINSFPGYELRMEERPDGTKKLCNMFRGIDVGFGGYVYANHGIYFSVALLDVASMHPTSIINLNLFGKYTRKYQELLESRLAIKHKDFDRAGELLDGKLKPYLLDKSKAKKLSNALKLPLNSQYGLTSAKFECAQRDVRNINNIVALRGALFMKTLQDAVEEKGYIVAHIKTDSIKIPNADKGIIDFCMEMGHDYGYTFEHEATYEKLCLITDADYIAKYEDWQTDKDGNSFIWTATGAQFSHPYVFKKLFSREVISFSDLCESKSVTSTMALDMNENLNADEHDYRFVGKVGSFCPIKPNRGGGILLRKAEDKYNAVTGTKGYRWLQSTYVRDMHLEDDIDLSYFDSKTDDMYNKIAKFGDAEFFCSNNGRLESEMIQVDDGPVVMECGGTTCSGCPNLDDDGYHKDCKVGMDNSSYLMEGDL